MKISQLAKKSPNLVTLPGAIFIYVHSKVLSKDEI
jgi:hypothetical protein